MAYTYTSFIPATGLTDYPNDISNLCNALEDDLNDPSSGIFAQLSDLTSGKIDLVSGTTGNITKIASGGGLADANISAINVISRSGVLVNNKLPMATGGSTVMDSGLVATDVLEKNGALTSGNIPKSNGTNELVDSGIIATNVAQKATTLATDSILSANSSGKVTNSGFYITDIVKRAGNLNTGYFVYATGSNTINTSGIAASAAGIKTAYESNSNTNAYTDADKADVAALGTMSTQNSNAVAVTGGSIVGITDLAPADGGSGRSSATAYAPICGGTSPGGTHQSATTGMSTPGNVLVSTGAGSLPEFQPLSGYALTSDFSIVTTVVTTSGGVGNSSVNTGLGTNDIAWEIVGASGGGGTDYVVIVMDGAGYNKTILVGDPTNLYASAMSAPSVPGTAGYLNVRVYSPVATTNPTIKIQARKNI